MTGGTVVVLGPVGANFGAGMTGGRAYLYDPTGRHVAALADGSVQAVRLAAVVADREDGATRLAELLRLLEAHRQAGSALAGRLLDDADLPAEMWVVEPVAVPVAIPVAPAVGPVRELRRRDDRRPGLPLRPDGTPRGGARRRQRAGRQLAAVVADRDDGPARLAELLRLLEAHRQAGSALAGRLLDDADLPAEIWVVEPVAVPIAIPVRSRGRPRRAGRSWRRADRVGLGRGLGARSLGPRVARRRSTTARPGPMVSGSWSAVDFSRPSSSPASWR